MNDFEAWIGECHLRKTDGEDYRCQAAVWAQDHEGFHAALSADLSHLGYSIVWLEEVLPAPQYLSLHRRQHRQIGSLARAVHPGHTVELGPMQGIEAGNTDALEDHLTVEEIKGVEPLDLQFGIHPGKTVPDALMEPIFGQPEPTEAENAQYAGTKTVPSLKTYAILDSAKIPYILTSLLESSDLRYQSLFQGKTQEELEEHAPYLVELKPESGFTKQLFTGLKGVNGLWEKELGIFIRSRTNFDDIRRHFRKFTRVQDKDGKWFYFRFWEAKFFIDYVLSLQPDKQKIIVGDCHSFVITRKKATYLAIRNQSSSSSSSASVMGKSGELNGL
ncbi:hypothetical protein TH25_08465 [Thalassospira profundimaris]|uniref:DUF4123 domain-containing protein n=1 Tax=Thalassospira profundimaris TaxID=502049 RepID=A0A367XEZ9_9PROT|nr:DUF4123 domain-containing protein [Thalassospira profundimaris]RCK51700.1 hypothetical protein TH25_08465 [Thalassospira profundimaris]